MCRLKYAFWTQYLCLQAGTDSFTGRWVCLSNDHRFPVPRHAQTFCASCFLDLICSYSCVPLVNYKWKMTLNCLLTARRGASVSKSRCVWSFLAQSGKRKCEMLKWLMTWKLCFHPFLSSARLHKNSTYCRWDVAHFYSDLCVPLYTDGWWSRHEPAGSPGCPIKVLLVGWASGDCSCLRLRKSHPTLNFSFCASQQVVLPKPKKAELLHKPIRKNIFCKEVSIGTCVFDLLWIKLQFKYFNL